MNDDIVTRLREYEAITDNAYVINALVGAADEIERLRVEVSRLMQIICDSSPDDDFFLVRQEADAIWEQIHKKNKGA